MPEFDPIRLSSTIRGSTHEFTLHSPLTVILGPNGSGKTQLLRGSISDLRNKTIGLSSKKTRFLSAGRLASIEPNRSDLLGQQRGNPNYALLYTGSRSDSARRHEMESVTGDFLTLSERSDILIKVQERLRKLFGRELTLEWNGGSGSIWLSSSS